VPAERERLWGRFFRNLTLTLGTGIVLWGLFLFLSAPIGAHPPIRSYIPPLDFELLESAAILGVAYLFGRSVASALEAHEAREVVVSHAYSLRLFVNLLITSIVILLLFLVFGTDVQSIFFGSAFLGIVLGLAAQTVLSNVFSGITLVASSPFRAGDRISLISSSYGALAPSHPHETLYPAYTGTVRDTGLIYTVLQLDNGRIARIPNSVVLQALVVNLTQTPFHSQRVRITLPLAVPLSVLEDVLREYSQKYQPAGQGVPPPRVEVAEVASATWDGVVVLWTVESNEELIRDRVLRLILPRAQDARASANK
jgi:small conductance mechanosensitive channel